MAARKLNQAGAGSTSMKPNTCNEYCFKKGYMYSALQVEMCYCGDFLPTTSATCDMKCVGDSSKTCGGSEQVTVYKLQETSWTTQWYSWLFDSANNGAQVTFSSSPSVVSGIIGSAVKLNGVSQYITLKTPSNIICLHTMSGCTGFTIGGYVKITILPDEDNYIFASSTSSQQGFDLGYVVTDTNLPCRRRFRASLRTASKKYEVIFDMNTGDWEHVLLTWTSSLGLSVYVDGFLVSTDSTGSSGSFASAGGTNGQIIVGRDFATSAKFAQVDVDHFKLWLKGFDTRPTDMSEHRMWALYDKKKAGTNSSSDVSAISCRQQCVSASGCLSASVCHSTSGVTCYLSTDTTEAVGTTSADNDCDMYTVFRAGVTDTGTCYKLSDVTSPVEQTLPSTVTIDSCKKKCYEVGSYYALIVNAEKCYCYKETPTQSPAGSSSCDKTCSDGRPCGGSVASGFASSYLVTNKRVFTDTSLTSVTLNISDTTNIDLEVSGTIFFSMTVNANARACYDISYGDNKPSVLTEQDINSHTYSSLGVFNLVVTAKNSLGSKVKTVTVNVYRGIGSLTLNVPSDGASQTSIPLSLTMASGSNASCNIDMGDGNTETQQQNGLDLTVNFPHTYTVLGSKTISVTCSNPVSTQTESATISIQEKLTNFAVNPTTIHTFKDRQTNIDWTLSSGTHFSLTVSIENSPVPSLSKSFVSKTPSGSVIIAGSHFSQYKSHSVILSVNNNVTAPPLAVTVTVDATRELSAINLTAAQTSLEKNKNIEFTVVVTGGYVTVDCDFGDNTAKETKTQPGDLLDFKIPIYHTFQSNGEFTITCIAKDDLSSPVIQSTLAVTVQDGIQDLKVEKSQSEGETNELKYNIIIKATHFGTGSCFVIDFGDGEAKKIVTGGSECKSKQGLNGYNYQEFTTTFPHEYDVFGVYTVHVYGFNAISQANASLTLITDNNYDCVKPPLTHTEYSQDKTSPSEHPKSLPISVKVIIGQSCKPIMPLKIVWTVTDMDTNSPVNSLTSDSAELSVPANALAFSTYHVNITVSPSKIPQLANSLSVYIKVVPTPLSISIYGGSPRTFPVDKDIILDARDSIDPDASSASGITFEWYCAKKGETIPRDGNKKPVTAMPSGSGGCAGNGPGRLSESSTKLTFNANSFQAGTSLTIVLVGKKDSRYTEVTQVVEIIAAGSAEISINCKGTDNCGEEKFVHLSLTFEGSCDSCTALDRTTQTYTWTVTENGNAVPDFSSKTETGTDKKDIVIKKDQLKQSTKYTLKLSIPPAFAEIDFTTATYPSGGACVVIPNSGKAQETDFKVSCNGYSLAQGANNMLTYVFSYVRRGTSNAPTTFDEVTAESPTSRLTKLPAGLETQGELVDVRVDVCSKIRACSLATIPVQVVENKTPLESLTSSASETLSELQNSKDTAGITATITSISQGIPKVAPGAPVSAQTNTDEMEKRKEDSEKLNAILIDTLDDVNITGTTIDSVAVALTSVAEQGTDNIEKDSMNKMIKKMQKLGNSSFITPSVSVVVVEGALSIADGVSKCGNGDCATKQGECSEDGDLSPKECRENAQADCKSCQETGSENGQVILDIVEKGMANAAGPLVNGQELKVETEGMTAKVRKVDPADSSAPIPTDADGGSFQMNMSLFIDVEAVKSLVVVTLSSKNVLMSSGNTVTSGTQSLSLSTDAGPLSVSGLSEPIIVSIPAPPATDTSVKINCSSKFSKTVIRVDITDPNKQMFLFVSQDSPGMMDVFINEDAAPNVTEGIYSQHEKLNFTENSAQKVVINPPTNPNATFYMIQFNSNCTGEVTFNFTALAMGCSYFNKQNQQWQSDGLSLDTNKTSKSSIVCQSSHLTDFGASFFVPPNSIDFSTLFDNIEEKLKENAPVIATVCSILGIYAILALILRRMDKRDVVKWATTPLSDNTPLDVYHYHVTVFTTAKRNAGTKSNVFFMLAGEYGDTEVRKLEDTTKKKALSSGSVNNYLLSNPSSLGPLLYLRIWHDNSAEGEYASWHLDRIVINDIQTDEKYVFLCDHWMAVDMADGQLERLLPAASRKDLENFQYMFYSKTRQDMSDEHLWFSLASRPTRSRFTRVQRLSCCLALLYATMIANCMFFRAEDNVENVSMVKLGPFTFSAQQLTISVFSSLVSVPITVLIVALFRKAGKKPKKPKADITPQRAKSPVSDEQLVFETKEQAQWEEYDTIAKTIMKEQAAHNTNKRVKKIKKQWPWWVTIVAYILVVITVVVSGTFTIFYSFEWGGVKSSQWLTSFLMSFVQSVVIIQPVKVITMAIILSLIFKKHTNEEEEDNSLEDDEIFIEVMKDRSCHPEKYVIPEHRVPFVNKDIDPVKLEHMRKRREKEVKMFEMLREVASYLLYVLVICIVSYDNRDTNAFAVKNEVNSLLLGKTFTHISSREQFWNWTQDTMIPALYKTKFYNGQKCTWRPRLFMDDLAMMRVGAPRIRQQRVKSDSCKVAPVMKDYTDHCYGTYGPTSAEETSYGYRWQTLTTNTTDNSSFWVYRTASELNGAPIWGRESMYGGGGYVAELSSRPYTAKKVIDNISQSDWLDSKTRAIFIEVNLYNPNVNLFCIVTIMFEWLPTGGAMQTVLIKPLRLYHHVGPTALFRYIVEFLFAVFTLYFIIVEGKKMYKLRKRYFQSFWNIIELIIIILSVSTCGLYGMHYVISRLTLSKFQEDREVFTNFQYIVYWDEMFGYTLAFTVFLVMVKTLRVLRFNKTVSVLLSALRVAAKPLLSFFLFFTIIFCAFAQFAYCVFGKKLLDYSSFVTTMETQFSMLMMMFRFNDLYSVSNVLGPAFFIIYTLFIIFVTMNMLISIINESFYRIQMNKELIGDDYEVIDFMMVQFKKMVGINDQFVSAEEQRKENSSKTKNKISMSTVKKAAAVHELSLRGASWQNPITYELYKY